MTSPEEILYRFCGVQEPHVQHLFFQTYGHHIGGVDLTCLGWMTWQV